MRLHRGPAPWPDRAWSSVSFALHRLSPVFLLLLFLAGPVSYQARALLVLSSCLLLKNALQGLTVQQSHGSHIVSSLH